MPRKKKAKKLSIKQGIILLLIVFAIGWLAHNVFSVLANNDDTQAPFSLASPEVSSPGDWIKEKQIWVYDDKIIIWVDNPTWGKFTDTNSMDPFIDVGANSIEIKPASEDEIDVGNVVSFHSEHIDGLVIHRIIEKGIDDDGVYFITKGDNNKYSDPGKLRFENIQGVVVGVIY